MTPALETSPTPQPQGRPGWFRRSLRRHSRAITAAWLLGTLAACAWAIAFVVPTYRAASLLRVGQPEALDLIDVKTGNFESTEAYMQTQVQLITSPNVLIAAAKNPKVAVLPRIQKAGDVLQELKDAISVAVLPRTYLIEVSATSPDSYEAATLVNAVVDSFMTANEAWSDGLTRSQIKTLEAYSQDLRNQTDELERKWMLLAAKGDIDPALLIDRKKGDNPLAGIEPGTNRASITVDQFRSVNTELKQVELALSDAQAWLESIKQAEKTARSPDVTVTQEKRIERRFKLDPEVVELASEMQRAREKISSIQRTAAGPGDPAEKLAARKLEALNSRYQTLWETKSTAIREEMNRADLGVRGADPAQEVFEATAAVNKLTIRHDLLREHYKNLDLRYKDQATDAVKVVLIQDERQALKEMQAAVTRRLEQIKFEARGEARIRVVTPGGAPVPGRPASDRRLLALSFVLLVASALFAGFKALSGPEAVATKVGPAPEV